MHSVYLQSGVATVHATTTSRHAYAVCLIGASSDRHLPLHSIPAVSVSLRSRSYPTRVVGDFSSDTLAELDLDWSGRQYIFLSRASPYIIDC